MTSNRKYPVFHVDAFTRTPSTGNSAGVVLSADGLSDNEMLAIARELRHSETAFVFEPDCDDHDIVVRFFTPTTEVPSCGHATIALNYVRAKSLRLPAGIVRQKCGAGILEIEIQIAEDGDYRIRMTQAPPQFRGSLGSTFESRMLMALGLTRDDLDPRCPIEIGDTGHSKVLIGLKSAEVLDSLSPDEGALITLSADLECNGYHVFTLHDSPKEVSFRTNERQRARRNLGGGAADAAHPDPSSLRSFGMTCGPIPPVLTECRMFAPAIGISEDPVTGNGNGPLGAYLVRHGLAGNGSKTFRFASLQGKAMGRPGIARVEIESNEEHEPTRVTVGEDAVIVHEGEWTIDGGVRYES